MHKGYISNKSIIFITASLLVLSESTLLYLIIGSSTEIILSLISTMVEVALGIVIFFFIHKYLSVIKNKFILFVPILNSISDLLYGISNYYLQKNSMVFVLSTAYMFMYLLASMFLSFYSIRKIKFIKKDNSHIFSLVSFVAIFVFTAFTVSFLNLKKPDVMQGYDALEVFSFFLLLLIDSISIGFFSVMTIFVEDLAFQMIYFGISLMLVSRIQVGIENVQKITLTVSNFELGWILGLVFILSGLIKMKYMDFYSLDRAKKTFFKLNTLKVRTVFIVFICLISLWFVFGISTGSIYSSKFISFSLSIIILLIFISSLVSGLLTKSLYDAVDLISEENIVKMTALHKYFPDEINAIVQKFVQLSNKLLDEKNSSLKLSAKLAHDLKSPISGIKVVKDNLKVIKSDSRNLDTEKLEMSIKLLDMISDSVQGITNDVLSKRKEIMKIETVSKAINDAFEISKIAHPDRIFIFESGFDIRIDRIVEGLTRVLVNIFNNAVDASPVDKPIELTVVKGPSSVVIKIKDYGCGIPESTLMSLLKGNSFTNKVNGNGIGVSSMVSWANINKFKFNIESTVLPPNNGTEFSLEIPL